MTTTTDKDTEMTNPTDPITSDAAAAFLRGEFAARNRLAVQTLDDLEAPMWKVVDVIAKFANLGISGTDALTDAFQTFLKELDIMVDAVKTAETLINLAGTVLDLLDEDATTPAES